MRSPYIGADVLYVMPNGGRIRPAKVVEMSDSNRTDGLCNLQVFTDGLNDHKDGVAHQSQGTMWCPSIHCDQEHKAPGTYHWPEEAIAQDRIVRVVTAMTVEITELKRKVEELEARPVLEDLSRGTVKYEQPVISPEMEARIVDMEAQIAILRTAITSNNERVKYEPTKPVKATAAEQRTVTEHRPVRKR